MVYWMGSRGTGCILPLGFLPLVLRSHESGGGIIIMMIYSILSLLFAREREKGKSKVMWFFGAGPERRAELSELRSLLSDRV